MKRTEYCDWLHKDFAMQGVEVIGAFPCKLYMLDLVLADRNMSSSENS